VGKSEFNIDVSDGSRIADPFVGRVRSIKGISILILKHIYLEPMFGEYPNEILLPFRFQSRGICNFVERHLKKESFRADGFNRISIALSDKLESSASVNSSNVLAVVIAFEPKEILKMSDIDKNAYFKKLIEEGISKGSEVVALPSRLILGALEEFIEQKCENKWIHKSRTFREHGLKCSLQCEVTLFDFELSFLVFKKGKEVFQEKIFVTTTDELSYSHKLKDFKIKDTTISVFDKKGDVFYQKDISSLL